MTGASPPNIPMLPREEWTDPARDVFAFWEGEAARKNGSRSNTMMALAQHPRLALAVLDLGKYMLVGSTLTQRHKEIVVLRVAWRSQVDYEWAHHVHSARQIGMTDQEIASLRLTETSPLWSREEQALIDSIDQLSNCGRIDRCCGHVGERELDELLHRRLRPRAIASRNRLEHRAMFGQPVTREGVVALLEAGRLPDRRAGRARERGERVVMRCASTTA